MVEITHAVYQRAKAGYDVSGDAYLIQEYDEEMLICLADGLGSGPAAAEASHRAIEWVADHYQAPLPQIVQGCHAALRETRGAVMALMRIDTVRQQLGFVGVGNVEFHACSAQPMRPISYGGIVGSRLPSLHEFNFTYTLGDLIILHTDGISRRFSLDGLVERMRPTLPQRLVKAITDGYAKRNDDVTLIVVSLASGSETGVKDSQIEVNYGQDTGR